MKRHAALTLHARRLTPAEVAQHWFRRAAAYAHEIHSDHPSFPKPGPDGLYLLSQVEAWFDRVHGRSQISAVRNADEEAEIMRLMSGKR